MNRLSTLMAVAVATGALLLSTPLAQAGGDLDDGSGKAHRHTGYEYDEPHGEQRINGCMRGVRAVGSGWPFSATARRSAIRAWERETRYVHGDAYASWEHARHQDIECKYINAISQRCEARANPCRL